ncbi:MAG: sulfatase-like hydrolase/transferase [Thermoleophilaceae bacterium]
MRAPAIVLLLLLVAAVAAVGYALGNDGADAPLPTQPPPVVVLVLDEFPADTLLTPGAKIDAERYPNFAALARTSTWFRDGSTVYDSTFKAVPAILDARMPRPRTAPDVRSHQPSVFHLMDRHGYDVIKVESASAVCPPRICAGALTRRPGVLKRLAGGSRAARLHKWIGAIRERPRPTFYFHHVLLPHEPWIYLPSGHQSRPTGNDPIPGINKPPGFHDPNLTDENHLRHLLQVGFVDRELGLLIRRMRRTELFDKALLVVVADHGYSFELNVPGRRQVRETNIDEIASVPFFVKAPGQTEGVVDDSLVRNIDVVPTIADLLGFEVWWRTDGYSAFSETTRAREQVTMSRRDFSRVISIDRDDLEALRERRRRWRAAKFSTGAKSLAEFGDPWAAAYRIGPHQELLGEPVEGKPVARPSSVRGVVANAALLDDVDPAAQILPTRVTGRLTGSPPEGLRDLAVAVNGRIRAVGRSFRLRGRPTEYFSMLVPETSLRPGRNHVELFEVGSGGRLTELADV